MALGILSLPFCFYPNNVSTFSNHVLYSLDLLSLIEQILTITDGHFYLRVLSLIWKISSPPLHFHPMLVGGELWESSLSSCWEATPAECPDKVGMTDSSVLGKMWNVFRSAKLHKKTFLIATVARVS